MINFIPESLKNEFLTILNKFDFLEGEIDGITFDELKDEECYDDYDLEVSGETEVYLYIGEDSIPIVNINFLLDIFNKWENTKLNNAQSYAQNENEVDFLLNIPDYDDYSFLDALLHSENPVVEQVDNGINVWHVKVNKDGKVYDISLFNGFCLYHLLVQESGNYEDFFPAYSKYDYFIRILCNDGIELNVADSLAQAFMFELYATHNLKLEFSKGRLAPGTVDYYKDDFKDKTMGIFPLIRGKGIKEITELYNSAKITTDIDYKILNFTKVIEFISPTIANEELYKSVSLKLTSPLVFAPTSEFMDELGNVYKKHQSDISKDSELIKLAIFTVVELSDIWELMPEYIKPKNVDSIETMDEATKETLLENLASAIYDTRNEIAHAKANYRKKGKECAPRHKEQFSRMLDTIAIKCIRWFSMQSDDKRVVIS